MKLKALTVVDRHACTLAGRQERQLQAASVWVCLQCWCRSLPSQETCCCMQDVSGCSAVCQSKAKSLHAACPGRCIVQVVFVYEFAVVCSHVCLKRLIRCYRQSSDTMLHKMHKCCCWLIPTESIRITHALLIWFAGSELFELG